MMMMKTTAGVLLTLKLQHAFRHNVTFVPDTSVAMSTRLKSAVSTVASIIAQGRCLEVMLSGVSVTRTANTRVTMTALSATALIFSAARTLILCIASNHCALGLMNTVIDGWFPKTFSA